jgi:predicted esterase
MLVLTLSLSPSVLKAAQPALPNSNSMLRPDVSGAFQGAASAEYSSTRSLNSDSGLRRVAAPDGTDVSYLWSGPVKGPAAQTVILFAPGSGDEAMARRVQSLYWTEPLRRAGWGVATPISPSGAKYFQNRPDLAAAVADDVILHSGSVRAKHLVMGVSNGGADALAFSAAAPGRVLATTVFPGLLDPQLPTIQLSNLREKPIVMFVGADDTAWVQGTHSAADALRASGARVIVQVLSGQGHVLTFNAAAFFELQRTLAAEDPSAGLHTLVANADPAATPPADATARGSAGVLAPIAAGGAAMRLPAGGQRVDPNAFQPNITEVVPEAADDARRREVSAVLDDFHDAAAKADEPRYFNHFLPEAVFFGTDLTERWTYAQFRAWAKPHFENGKGWKYIPRERSVFFAPSGECAWFDELVENKKLGTCRGTGVLVKTEGVWRIAQYHLVLPVPNELAEELAEKASKINAGGK